jgi:hypothetical protein
MNVATRVVVQINGLKAILPCKHRAMIMRITLPLKIVHAQAMHEYENLAALWKRLQSLPLLAKLHLYRQRVLRSCQGIAQYTIRCRPHRLAIRLCRFQLELGAELLHSGRQSFRNDGQLRRSQAVINPPAHSARDPAHTFVNQPSDAARLLRFAIFACQRQRKRSNRPMHLLHQIRDAFHSLNRQCAGAAHGFKVAVY